MLNLKMNKMTLFVLTTIAILICVPSFLSIKTQASTGNTYYVSSSEGNDYNDGLSKSEAWNSLEKVNSQEFEPGDKILFKAGDEWDGSLKLENIEGTEQAPIIFDKYGSSDSDKRPVLNGNGTTSDEPYSIYTYYDLVEDKTQSATIDVLDGSHLEFNNFEITNYNEDVMSQRAGIAVKTSATNQEEWEDNPHEGITIKNNYIHDVNGDPDGHKMGSGGILLLGNISDVLVDNNKVIDVDIEGIRNAGLYKEGDIPENFPKKLSNIQFSNNEISRVQGDGMVMSNVGKNGSMKYNKVKEFANKDVGNVNYAGLWVIAVKDTVVEYNEVYDGKYGYNDGEAFDIDMFSEGTLFQYNYSHNNNGGFMLFMSGSTDSVVRHNVSVNDGGGEDQEIFHYLPQSEEDAPLIYNNTFFTDSDIDTQIFRNDTAESVYPKLYNNIFMSKGDVTMGAPKFNNGEIKNNNFYPGTEFKNQDFEDLIFEDNTFQSPKLSRPGEEPKDIIIETNTFNSTVLEGYKLMDGSSSIDAGIDVADYLPSVWDEAEKDIFNNDLELEIDIGAHKYANDQPDETNPEVLPTDISLNKNELTLDSRHMDATLEATVSPKDTWFKDVNWTSSDASIASVDDKGDVTAVSEGTAYITAESVVDADIKAVSKVTVENMQGLYNPTADTYIRGGQYANTNFGDESILSVKNDTESYTRQSFLQFDVNEVDSSIAHSAVLRLYANDINSDPERTISIYSTDHDWSESSLTWNNAPDKSKHLTDAIITKEGKWYEFDVSEYIKSGKQEELASFLLTNEGEATSKNDVAFTSKEEENNKPQLIVTNVSAEVMQDQVKQFEDEGEIKNDEAAHKLNMHLTAVNHYEENESAKKVVKHSKGLKKLLKYQKENDLISKNAYDVLKDDTNSMIKKWE